MAEDEERSDQIFLSRHAVNTAPEGDEERLILPRLASRGIGSKRMGLLSLGGLVMVWIEAPSLAMGFVSRGWPFVVASLFCGMGSLIEVWRFNATPAVIASAGAVAAVIWGWGISQ